MSFNILMSEHSRNLTILLTDIKEFTSMTSRKSREDILRMLEKHKEIVLPVLEGKGGRLIKTIGDAFLMVYDSPTDAVLAGVEVQEALADYNRDKTGDDRIDVRIAINTGEVTIADEDIFGDPVNITARIEAVTEAGEVYFTEAVYLAMNKKEVPSSEVGLLQLKGVPEKVRVYKVRKEHPVEDLPGPAGSSAPAKGFLGLLKPRSAEARGEGTAASSGKPVLRRKRLAALVVDAVLVSALAGMLTGDDRTEIHVRSKADEKGTPGIAMDKKGVRVGESIRIDKSGVTLSAKAKDRLADVRKRQAELDAEIKGTRKSVDDAKAAADELNAKIEALAEKSQTAAERSASEADRLVQETNDMIARRDKLLAGAKEDGERLTELHEEAIELTHESMRAIGDGAVEGQKSLDMISTVLGADDEVLSESVVHEDGRVKVTRRKRKGDKAFPMLWVIYSTFFLLYWGATPGKRLLKIKVVQANGMGLDWKTALVRSVFTLISGSFLMLGYLWAFFRSDHRTWHDLVAGTRVVAVESS